MAALQVKAGDDDSDSAFIETSIATCSTHDGSITAAGLGTDISNDSKVGYTEVNQWWTMISNLRGTIMEISVRARVRAREARCEVRCYKVPTKA